MRLSPNKGPTMAHLLDNAQRIDAACFVDGNDDEFVVEFFRLSGSIVRHCYNRRTTCAAVSFVPVDSWEYRQLERMADATDYQI